MASTRAISEWKPYRLFPWREYRYIGLFLDTAPGVLVDVNAVWVERRWRARYLEKENAA